MKIRSYIIAFAVLALAACNNIDTNPFISSSEVITAYVEDNGGATKAGFESDGSFYWSNKDSLGIVLSGKTSFSSFALQKGGGTGTGIFSGKDIESIGSVAVYPYNAAHSFAFPNLTYNFPASYTYTQVDTSFFDTTGNQGNLNSFCPPMWGKVEKYKVALKHLGGVFCVKIDHMPNSSGTVTFSADKKINGDYTVDLGDLSGTPSLVATSHANGADTCVTITYSGATTKKPGVFYIPVPTGTYNNVKLAFSNGDVYNAGTLTINRRSLKKVSLSSLTIFEGGIYYLPKTNDIVNINIGNEIKTPLKIVYAIGANENEKPSKVILDFANCTASDLTVDAPASDFEFLGGLATNLTVATKMSTLDENFLVSDKLTDSVGCVNIKGTVKDVQIDNTVSDTTVVRIADNGKVLSIENNSASAKIDRSVDNTNSASVTVSGSGDQTIYKDNNDVAYEFLNSVIKGGSVTLSEDIKITRPVLIAGDATVDLNGFSIVPHDSDSLVANHWISTSNQAMVVLCDGGRLTVNDSGSGKISVGSNTNINAAIKMNETGAAELVVNGGDIKGNKYGISQKYNLTTSITGGAVEGEVGIYVEAGTVSVFGGTITGTDNALKVYNGGSNPVISINSGSFSSANDAVVSSTADSEPAVVKGFIHNGTFSDMSAIKYGAKNATINVKLQRNFSEGEGVFVPADSAQTIVIDLNGKTYTVDADKAVGSGTTKNQAFHLEKGNNVTIKNGKIDIESGNSIIKRIFQNYTALTLEDVEIDGTNVYGTNSTVEFCNDTVNIIGSTSVKAQDGASAAITIDSWKGAYPDGTHVNVNTTGKVGEINCYSEGTGSMTKNSSVWFRAGQIDSLTVTSGCIDDLDIYRSTNLTSLAPATGYHWDDAVAGYQKLVTGDPGSVSASGSTPTFNQGDADWFD